MPLSKLLKKGDKITAVIKVVSFSANPADWHEHTVIKARVTWTGRGLIMYRNAEPGPVHSSLRRRDEGKTWARGWEGEDADALRATFLLQRSAS